MRSNGDPAPCGVKIQEKTKVGEYRVADNVEGVVSLAQMGIVEIHTWNSTSRDVGGPNTSSGISIRAPASPGIRW
jgi:DNA primase